MTETNPGAKYGIDPFKPSAAQGGTESEAAPGEATRSVTPETTSSPGLGDDFQLSNAATTGAGGLRSPDAIDRPGVPRIGNVINITTSVGVQSMPPEELAQLQTMLMQAGLTPAEYTPTGTLDDVTRAALIELKRTSQASGMSDIETLRTSIETQAQAAAGAFGGQPPDDGSGVSKQIIEPTFTDPLTARGIVRDAMQTRLGRAPTADEYHQFRGLLSNAEAGQDVVTNRTHVNKKGVSVTHTTRSDDTTDPTGADIADDMLSRGKLGREANTVQAADFFDIIAQRVGN